jgi:phosphatidylglycerophosphatase A
LGIRSFDRRKGAFWVMFDDILAGIYSAIVLYLIILIGAWVG